MRRTTETVWERGLLLSATVSGTITLLIFGFMLFMGFPLMRGGQFFEILTSPWAPKGASYGIYPMIVSTLGISFLSLAFAFPVSLGCACLIGVTGPRGLSRVFKRIVQMMTGIPTVIYGFVGVFLLVPLIRELAQVGSGMCILTAALILAVLISPTMILFFSDSFERVPKSYLDAADALGARKAQKFLYIVLPCARKGISIGLILALGRALGDTMVALMVAGNSIQVPGSVLDSARALTAHIALVVAADYESLEFKSIFACGVVLYLFVALIVLGVRFFESSGIGRKV